MSTADAASRARKGSRAAGAITAYVGTFTRLGPSAGLYYGEFDPDDGSIAAIESVPQADPSWLVVSTRLQMLYAASHVSDFGGTRQGGVTAFRIDPASGALERAGERGVPPVHPAHMSLDRTHRYLLVASTFGGGVSVLPLGLHGELGPASDVQFLDGRVDIDEPPSPSAWPSLRVGAPFAHAAVYDRDDRFVIVADTRRDRIYMYEFDAARGRLTPASAPRISCPATSNPRHLQFHSNGELLYVINERASTVSAYRYDRSRGALEHVQEVSTLPPGCGDDNLTAAIAIRGAGDYLFASNRGHNSVSVFRVREDGTLELTSTHACGGDWPRSISLSPDEALLVVANERSGTVVPFRISPSDGSLESTGAVIPLPTPTCVVFHVAEPTQIGQTQTTHLSPAGDQGPDLRRVARSEHEYRRL